MAGNRVIVFDPTNDRDDRAAISSLYTGSTDTTKCIAPDASNGLQVADIEKTWGLNWSMAAAWGEASTTSSPWVNRVTLSNYSVTSGYTYRVTFTFKLRTSAANKGVSGRCVIATESYMALDIKEDTDYHNFSGSLVLTAPITTTVDITIDYGRESPPATAYIKEARIEVWRVA